MGRTIWVSGASSGIGAAFIDAAPQDCDRIIGISRRPYGETEHIAADLGDPASWRSVEESFARELRYPALERPLFFHCAGTSDATGLMGTVDSEAYARAVICNAAAGQVLGRAFVAGVIQAGLGRGATMVMCSSPSAQNALPGLTHYCGGKAALEHWARSAAAEVGGGDDAPRIFSVVPRAVDTPMVRGAMDRSPEEMPIAGHFRELESQGGLVTPQKAAADIWKAIADQVDQGAAIPVGATAA